MAYICRWIPLVSFNKKEKDISKYFVAMLEMVNLIEQTLQFNGIYLSMDATYFFQ